jgi:AcrR family transcriptional regulator
LGRRKGPPLSLDDVVRAGVRVVEENGADALGISSVARQLGIRPPSLYNHVSSGDALVLVVARAGFRQLLGELARAAADAPTPDRAFALAAGLRRWARANPGLYALMARVPPNNEDHEGAAQVSDLLELFRGPLEALGVPSTERVHAIRSLRAAVHGFVLLENHGQFQLADSVDESFERMVRALLAGMR